VLPLVKEREDGVTGAGHHKWWNRDAARRASESGRLWWNRVTKTVLGVGALAAAIGAVLALLPSEESTERASITVTVLSESARLSDYEMRLPNTLRLDTTAGGGLASEGKWGQSVVGGTGPTAVAAVRPGGGRFSSSPAKALRLWSMATNQVTDEVECPHGANPPCPDETEDCPDPPCPDETEECPDPPCPDETEECPDPPCPDETDAPAERLIPQPHNGFSTLTVDQERALVESVVSELPPEAIAKVIPSPVDVEGDCNPVSECVAYPIATMIVAGGDAAAAQFEGLLDEIRTDDPDGAGELLGVIVNVRMDLFGLRGKPLLLWWQLYASNSDIRLFDPWLRTTPVYHLQTTKNEDSASFELWIPLPHPTGPYRVQVGLSLDADDSLPLDADQTDLFD
jgi:hypothetical protein